jgi:hypothetical protein
MSSGAGNSGGDGQGYAGQIGNTDGNSDINRHAFQHEQLSGEKRTHFVAKIVKVYNRNSLDEPCTVDIQPVVKQMDGVGKASSHGTIYGIPVPRNQSGDSVLINDPQTGDVANFSVLDRDHSSSQANDWAESNPGSFRRSSMSDAVFHSVMPRKGQAVKQFIRFDDGDGGLTIQDRNGNKLVSNKADGWNLNGVKIDKDGNLTSPKNITAGQGGADQVSLQGHIHGTGPAPTPGS